jgi:phospholipase A1
MTDTCESRNTVLMSGISILFFTIVFLFQVHDSKAGIIDFCKEPGEHGGYIDIEPHKPSYFIYAFGTPDGTYKNTQDLKFQFSVKQLLCWKIYFAYTQRSVWNYFDESSPFRESNYNPEVFVDLKKQEFITLPVDYMDLGLIGVEHESNGLGGVNSRSWNKVYWEPTLFYKKRDITDNSSDLFTVSIRGWTTFEVGEENKDIKDYLGDGNVTFQYKLSHYTSEEKKEKNIDKGIQAILKMRKGRRSDFGAIQLDISVKYLLPITFRLHFWDGYGETLVDYNVRATRYGIGITFASGTIF